MLRTKIQTNNNMANFDKALNTLEYHKILEMLADCATTDGARELARSLRPTDSIPRICLLLRQTSDAKHLIALKGAPSFGSSRDIIASVDRALKGAALSCRELLDIAGVLQTARRLLDYLNTEHQRETSLDVIFERLFVNRPLEDRITRSILADDLVADEASPELASIRRKIRTATNRIRDILQKYTGGGPQTKYLQENIVTMRNGRYVVPVKQEYKNEFKGLIHDTSASGATVFIEPLAVVETNNELKELESRERHEIERILTELSGACADYSDELDLNYRNITELAFIFAKAELSYRMKAAEPVVNNEERANTPRRIELFNARHPLLRTEKVVPINISLGGSYSMLVITGPNTGGKTVALKTLGLFSLMVQSGLHIPADDISEVCVFDEILADIGDEQSIEQSLSTFSAHMVNIVSILSSADERSLVLFDELGAGTDPVEGAALAEAILMNILERGSLCAATTHYAELKAFALETPGVMNAACEFDVETLRPTYRLIIGTPGKSNAFAISQKLGLDEKIIESANALISKDSKRFEYVIEELERRRAEMETERDAAAKMRREYESYRVNAERELDAKIKATEKELDRARAQAVRTVEGARASAEFALRQLEEVKKKQESSRFADELDAARRSIRRTLREAGENVDTVLENPAADGYVLPRPLKKGDEVVLINLGTHGTVADDPDAKGNVTITSGIISTRTNIDNLMLAEDAMTSFTDAKTKKTIPARQYANRQQATVKTFKPEIDLRGMNGDDAWFMVDKYLDDARMSGIRSVTLIHGKGTGALRAAIQRYLKSDPRVKSHRAGVYGEGDSGVTVVELK